jgi:hypothetical protein
MNFDETLNKILSEAYFGNSYEKATGMKQQITFTEDDDNDNLDDEAKAFMAKVKDASALQGTKLRVNLGLKEAVMVAYEAWIDAGQPDGKRGADVLIDAYLNAETGVPLAGDEVHVHDLVRGMFGLAYLTGVKNEKLANAEAKMAQKVAATSGRSPEEVYEARWAFHFDLDETGTRPRPLSREEKAAGISTKRQGKPIVSGERLRNILQQAQLKLKKGMDVQKAKQDQDMGDQEQARKNLAAWKASGGGAI